ncbi:MAG: energy-coupling factor transporter transmembrane component T [Neisseriaceae bacterium]
MKIIKLNNLTYIILSLVYFLVVTLSDSINNYLIIIGLTYLNLLIFNKFKLKIFFITLLLTIPTWLSFYLAANFFTTNSPSNLSILLTARVAAITISSIMFVSSIDFEELFLFLMQNLRFPVMFGYSFLSAINSLRNLKNEYTRINNAYLMRFGRKNYSISILYPMLISAARYAYYNGLSMECRGLNQNKTYIHKATKFSYIDLITITMNIILIIILIYILNL